MNVRTRNATARAADGVIGFNDPYHDASFCLYGAAACQHYELERFTRRKLERLSPLVGLLQLLGPRLPAVLDGCRAIGVVEGDFLTPIIRHLIFARAAGTAPARVADALLARLERVHRTPVPEFDGNLSPVTSFEPYRDGLRAFVAHAMRADLALVIGGHHAAHAANAFYSSPYADAVTVTLDGGGYDFLDGDSSGARTLVHGGAFRCGAAGPEPLEWFEDLSIGAAWSRVAADLLRLQFGEEGTVMAMAAYGDPARLAAKLEPPYLWSSAHRLGNPEMAAGLAAQCDALRRALRRGSDRFDLAAALQRQTEHKVYAILQRFVGPDARRLCLAGGVFLNCQVVGKIQEWFPWLHSVFLPPAPYDGGLSIGIAQSLYHGAGGARHEGRFPFATGPAYARTMIEAACRSRHIKPTPAGAARVAARLADGQIGAVFAGAAESGRRALGHRSILADPRHPGARDRINDEIKHRAPFRPLAPMVLAEHAAEWFECPAGFASPYMSHALRVRSEAISRIPAVVHRDGTARVQTVHAELTPVMHRLLSAWFAASGIPVLLNTSFNDQEPIVQTPGDALACYARTPLDFLYFADEELLCAKRSDDVVEP